VTLSQARQAAPRSGVVSGYAGNARFRAELGRWKENEIPRRLLASQRQFATEAIKRILQRSPVDTGKFRGHWIVSLGVKDGSLTGRRYRGRFGSAWSSAERARFEAIIAKMRTGERVYIVNNLPYAERLENGYSKMAPAGCVGLTFAELRAMRVKDRNL